MIWKNWNQADKVLLLAAAIFFFSLCLHLAYPKSLFAEGFMFCAEAALVGGIADWFAVTALFRKPLGFPYHTALLPRRRGDFIEASVTMVQKEFFSKRKILYRVKKIEMLPRLMEWLHEPLNQQKIFNGMIHYVRKVLLGENMREMSSALTGNIREMLIALPPEKIFQGLGSWLKNSGNAKRLLMMLAVYCGSLAEKEETRQMIKEQLEVYKKAQTQGFLGMLLSGFAEAANVVNLEEAAELAQKQLVTLLKEISEEDSGTQQLFLALCYEKASEISTDEALCEALMTWKRELVEGLPLESLMERMALVIREKLRTEDETPEEETPEEETPVMADNLRQIFYEEYENCFHLINTDSNLKHTVEHFLYDILMRCALHAQSLVGVVVTDVLERLTDEQLNHMVYDKVEPDLLWIRMNGSIVGAGIGLILFAVLKCVGA